MPFKKIKNAIVSHESPEALFQDLKRRTVAAPHAHQADVLRRYQAEALERPDVALQLPTGSGKTLVGLLIAEFRRRKFGERAVYLCPTNQLVHQVVDQARNHYGIDALEFVGSRAEYTTSARTDYQSGERIAVTSYRSLFNTNPFFENPTFIVLDDAHAAESYIGSYWSLRILRHEHSALFAACVNVLAPHISRTEARRLTSETNDFWDNTRVDKLPSPVLDEIAAELSAVIDAHVVNTDLRHPWKVLGDNLGACHLYIGASEFLLRPLIPPTLTHRPFAGAKQRLYMSATLSEGGDLERVTGVPGIFRVPVPTGWDQQGVGRRFFFFPGRSFNRADEQEFESLTIRLAGRALVLVKDEKSAKEYREWVESHVGCETFDARQIERSKKEFVDRKQAVAVIANRYDGIDFPKEQCRLLIVRGLPRATHLQERFFVAKMGAIALLNDRILTRVVQAFGRCTRDATDYSAVVVSGDELLTYLMTRERRTALHPELQAEIEFGAEQSRDSSIDTAVALFDEFLSQSRDWLDAEGEILARRQELNRATMPGTAELRATVDYELQYQYAIWNSDFPNALEAARQVLSQLTASELRGYRALWLYLAGSAAMKAARQGRIELEPKARDYFAKARDAAPSVRWLNRLLSTPEERNQAKKDDPTPSVIERLEEVLESLGTVHNADYNQEETRILNGIMSTDGAQFEEGHVRLGRLLGYETGNEHSTGAPDPWWIADEQLCFIFEDHAGADPNGRLSVSKARQAATHPNWVRQNLPISDDGEIIPVIVTPVSAADPEAKLHLKEVCYWRLQDFRDWAVAALGAIRELRRDFPGTGDFAWRAEAIAKYKLLGIDPHGLKARLLSQPANQSLS